MAFLFRVEGRAVFPNTEALLIYPFKDIWERDKSKNKEFAIEEFSYIEFMSSMKRSNPFRQYENPRKEEVVRKEVISRKDWKPDKLIKDAINKIERLQEEGSTTYSYYIAAKTAAEKMKNFFLEVDVNERNFKTGNPIYKPIDLTRALNETDKTLSNLKALEKKVEEEIYENVKTIGGKRISPFAKRENI